MAYVTTKGQLVIPARIRRRYGIKPGTKICFIEQENEIIFQPITKQYVRTVSGLLKTKKPVPPELLEKHILERKKLGAKFEKRGNR